jgi:hypothetical protein
VVVRVKILYVEYVEEDCKFMYKVSSSEGLKTHTMTSPKSSSGYLLLGITLQCGNAS